MDEEKTSRTEELNGLAWTYSQKSGELQQDGKPVASGYSGAGEGKNNPAMENIHNVGPIPKGQWTILGPPVNTEEHGPYALALKPSAETPTFGREGFLLHGDSKEFPGCASQGCIIMPRVTREQVWKSGDADLKVVAEIAAPTEDES
ncbi:MAG TPA: tlde1 domain-containing protein [Candidatus Sulfotelmatobacter sp.]|jgi:hypothetical protein|nr:tlde1 domain-containing protein [Candidatus Sulfotelmatobacter sp.]